MSLAFVIQEAPKEYIHHDQLFEQLLHNFFAEFLEAFFPEIHKHIDFSELKPLSEEMFTDLLEGESKRADIIIEVKLKYQETLIIVHVEPQSYVQSDFHERMFHYFSLLYNRYRKPVLPIAIFTYDQKRNEQNQFCISLPFFHVLNFQFLMLELKKMDWRSYIHTNNSVAAALLSKMGYTEKEKVRVKKEFLRMLVKMELNAAKVELINGFFEAYLSLTESEEEELMEEIKQLAHQEAEQIFKLPNSWREKGLKEGIQVGREEGKQEGMKEEKRRTAIEMLKEKLPFELIAKVTKLSISEIEDLNKML